MRWLRNTDDEGLSTACKREHQVSVCGKLQSGRPVTVFVCLPRLSADRLCEAYRGDPRLNYVDRAYHTNEPTYQPNCVELKSEICLLCFRRYFNFLGDIKVFFRVAGHVYVRDASTAQTGNSIDSLANYRHYFCWIYRSVGVKP